MADSNKKIKHLMPNYYALHPSRILFIFYFASYAIGAICILFSYFSWRLKIVIPAICIGAFLYRCFSKVLSKNEYTITAISFNKKAGWQLHFHHQQPCAALLQNSSVLTPYFMILHFRAQTTQKFFPLFIFYDAMSIDNFRRLRVQILTMR